MDTKRLQQRVVGSVATVDTEMKDRFTTAEDVARHMDWRLGDARMNEDPMTDGEPSEINDLTEDEGLLHMEESNGTLFVSGDIDLHQAPEFRKRAEMFINTTPNPRVDITRVAFLDSAGLATLLALSRHAKEQNKSVRLIAAGSPRRVLKITGIDRVLVIED